MREAAAAGGHASAQAAATLPRRGVGSRSSRGARGGCRHRAPHRPDGVGCRCAGAPKDRGVRLHRHGDRRRCLGGAAWPPKPCGYARQQRLRKRVSCCQRSSAAIRGPAPGQIPCRWGTVAPGGDILRMHSGVTRGVWGGVKTTRPGNRRPVSGPVWQNPENRNRTRRIFSDSKDTKNRAPTRAVSGF